MKNILLCLFLLFTCSCVFAQNNSDKYQTDIKSPDASKLLKKSVKSSLQTGQFKSIVIQYEKPEIVLTDYSIDVNIGGSPKSEEKANILQIKKQFPQNGRPLLLNRVFLKDTNYIANNAFGATVGVHETEILENVLNIVNIKEFNDIFEYNKHSFKIKFKHDLDRDALKIMLAVNVIDNKIAQVYYHKEKFNEPYKETVYQNLITVNLNAIRIYEGNKLIYIRMSKTYKDILLFIETTPYYFIELLGKSPK